MSAVPRIRVLIADDQALFREGLRTLLSTRPEVEVVAEAANGLEALAMAAQLQPAVVLMDLQMPEMDGWEAARQIRQCERETGGRVPIVALTAHAMGGAQAECLAAGMDGVIVKPFDPEQFYDVIEKAAGAVVGGELPVGDAY